MADPNKNDSNTYSLGDSSLWIAYDKILSASGYNINTGTGSTSKPKPKSDPQYSWIAGLDQCPKCGDKDVVNSIWYCDECSYGKKECKTKKPPVVKGFEYIKNKEYPDGKYFRIGNPDLFETVIIEPYKKQMILEALSLVENSELIFKTWGFEETIEKGTGVSLLFHGIPGSGKTLMAQAIADYLGKKLIQITAAEVLDKYVGESERKIANIFEKHPNDVILFDECDSLLYGRHKAVTSWQVSQVNVLLNKLENHKGVTVFTTNDVASLDKALDRRIAVKLRFEMPDKELRKQIWQRMFPKKAPLDQDVDWDLLADFEVTGGYVKNAVLRSARLAAYRNLKTITFAVIKEALKQELQALNEYQTNTPKRASKAPEKTKILKEKGHNDEDDN